MILTKIHTQILHSSNTMYLCFRYFFYIIQVQLIRNLALQFEAFLSRINTSKKSKSKFKTPKKN